MPTPPPTPDAPPADPPAADDHPKPRPADPFRAILDRPPDHRRREYQYRFAQSLVFGLPVIALERFGYALGGHDALRWVAFLQFLLTTWVLYTGAAGMLFEGLLHLPRRITADLVVAAVALALYGIAVFSLSHIFLTGRLWPSPLLFPWAVALVAAWTGLQWARHARRR